MFFLISPTHEKDRNGRGEVAGTVDGGRGEILKMMMVEMVLLLFMVMMMVEMALLLFVVMIFFLFW